MPVNDRLGEQMLSIREVATYMNVSIRTIQRWIRNGTLRAYRVGGLLRIPPLAVEHMLRPEEVFDPYDESHKQLNLF
jgi:excisionase family DNA binding protein